MSKEKGKGKRKKAKGKGKREKEKKEKGKRKMKKGEWKNRKKNALEKIWWAWQNWARLSQTTISRKELPQLKWVYEKEKKEWMKEKEKKRIYTIHKCQFKYEFYLEMKKMLKGECEQSLALN